MPRVQRQRQEKRQALPAPRRHPQDHPRDRRRVAGRILVSGSRASLAAAAVAAACSRVENRHAARPMNAVTHIYDGGPPLAHDGDGRRNTLLGFAIHSAASIWWAAFHEVVFRGKGAAVTAALAYFVDYYVVPRRLRPGFEAYLSPCSMAAVYTALAAGLAAGSRIRTKR